MTFLDKLSGSAASSPQEAALACAVTVLMLDGDLNDLERRIIGLFRDEFPPLSQVDEPVFVQILNRVVSMVSDKKAAADIPGFVNTVVAPAITAYPDRLAAYRYVYALAMADLIVDDGETALLAALQSGLGLKPADCRQAEQDTLAEFKVLHQALASVALGLMVVSADGAVAPEELEDLKNARNVLDTLGKLDDTQFGLVFDLGLNIHDRYLLDPQNRQGFLQNIVANMLNTPDLRREAFNYAAHIATADGDIAQAEIDMLKSLIQVLQIPDADGEAIFNQYMARVKTINGKPR
jgi:uncharacterized tellurite resistance protein B-like protein